MFKKAIMPQEDVCLYFGTLFHGAGQNMSDDTRIGASIQYVQPWIRPQENNLLSVIGSKITDWSAIPKRLKQMIGASWHPEGGHTGLVEGDNPLKFVNNHVLKSKM